MYLAAIKKTFGATVVAVGLAAAEAAGAATLSTPPIQPGEGQKLVCTVVNVRGRDIDFTVSIIDRFGGIVTDFVRTDRDATETILLTVRAESGSPDARYCRIDVTRG